MVTGPVLAVLGQGIAAAGKFPSGAMDEMGTVEYIWLALAGVAGMAAYCLFKNGLI